ncbi:hypothetical protein HOLleu_01088 [Holothuria leucospilota]|uniref:Uncharacterized protein n=1 Tax=Holothuria leucospilota TaxID=206669 RepID=A0A9Q1CPZ6_HOLLE|nr:hypothetical protein HOLleu_01088 [Holothuria leucospilota]
MNPATEEIINTELVQVSDTTSSVAMEKHGFRICLDKVEDSGVTVELIATDRHAGIRKLLSEEDARLKLWLKQGSPSHLALEEVVLNKTILKDLDQLVYSCHTGALEVFHNSLLKYCPKRLEFTNPHMEARMRLAVLDHNMNLNRKQAVVKKASRLSRAVGEPRYTLSYSKARKQWVAKKVYEAKTYEYVDQMMVDTLRVFEGNLVTTDVAQPERPRNIANVPRLDKQTVVTHLKARFALPASSSASTDDTGEDD